MKKHNKIDISFDLPNEYGAVAITSLLISSVLLIVSIGMSSFYSRTFSISLIIGIIEWISVYSCIISFGMGIFGLKIKDSNRRSIKISLAISSLLLCVHVYIYMNGFVI